MPVYIRTAAGTAAALNPMAKLPRNLRLLLVAIDGATPAHVHAQRMVGQGDMAVLLDTLQRAGLIRQLNPGVTYAPVTADRVTNPNHSAGGAGVPMAVAPKLVHDAPSSPAPMVGTPPPLAGNPAAPNSPLDVDITQAASQAATGAESGAASGFESHTAPAGLRPASAVYYELGNVISFMSDFVTQHLPERSLEIVLALESLGSVAQVWASLNDYRALVAQTGDAAVPHLVELERMLDAA